MAASYGSGVWHVGSGDFLRTCCRWCVCSKRPLATNILVLLPIALLLAAIVFSQVQSRTHMAGVSCPLSWLSLTLLVLSVLAISTASLRRNLTMKIAGITVGVLLIFVITRRDSQDSVKLLPSGA